MHKLAVVSLFAGQVSTGHHGFDAIAKLHAELSLYSNQPISIDFQYLRWIDAHLATLLMIVVRRAQSRGNIVNFINMAQNIRLILAKNGFLNEKAPDSFHTTMPVTEFDLTEGVRFSQYTRDHVMRPEMPKMTKALQGKFYEALDELFANSSLHSRSELHICVSGQFYPKTGRLAFALADGGVGMNGAVLAGKQLVLTPIDAIDWALQPGNTTRSGDIPGGLGLKLIRSFIEQNGGRLTIVSNEGNWCQTGSQVAKSTLSQPFPGTGVILEIATTDKKHYDLAAAPDPRNIW